ncbi:MAG: HigA family addiction module antidote protein [Bacteroidales bacterium]|nr:HigA family addiction module antidote protein [Bacteroidales bacterium]
METKNNNGFTPFKAAHPGGILAMELEERGISQKDFAKQIGMFPSNLNRIIKEKAPITEAIAEKLEQALGTKAYLWIAMQKDYERDSYLIARSTKKKETTPQNSMNIQLSYIENLTNALNRLSDQIEVLIAQNQNNSKQTLVH